MSLVDTAPVELDLGRLFRPADGPGSGWRRMPAIAAEAMVATSHPLATRAGLRALERGGNAVDAALAAAAVLTVAEPTDNGPGGDAFALAWFGGELHGLNGSGRSPAVLDSQRVDRAGPRSVTVPGAVRAWADLAADSGSSASTRRSRPRWTSPSAASPALRGSPTSGPAPSGHPGRRRERGSATACPSSARRCGGSRRTGPMPLCGRGRARDRLGLLALGGGSRRAPLGVGRAAALRLSRRGGLRAAAERAGRRGPARARPLRRPAADAALADRGGQARARRRLRPLPRRAVPGVPARARPPGRAAGARAARPGARPRALGAAGQRHDVPLCRGRRAERRLADPVASTSRSAPGSSRRGPASSCRIAAPASSRPRATRTASSPPSGRSTRSSRECCSRAAACSARSA